VAPVNSAIKQDEVQKGDHFLMNKKITCVIKKDQKRNSNHP
jgi:hypothetical protein